MLGCQDMENGGKKKLNQNESLAEEMSQTLQGMTRFTSNEVF